MSDPIDALKRLKEHNSGKNRYTKAIFPWKIIYTEQHPDWATARFGEKYLKSTAGKNSLKKYFHGEIRVPCLLDAGKAGNPVRATK